MQINCGSPGTDAISVLVKKYRIAYWAVRCFLFFNEFYWLVCESTPCNMSVLI